MRLDELIWSDLDLKFGREESASLGLGDTSAVRDEDEGNVSGRR